MDLTSDELDALKPFELEDAGVRTETSAPRARTRARGDREEFATALLRSDAVSAPSSPRYSPIVNTIPPTSNHCEILFSQCKLVMTPQRSSLLPVNFEMLAFLRANRKYWDAYTLMNIEIADTDENVDDLERCRKRKLNTFGISPFFIIGSPCIQLFHIAFLTCLYNHLF